METFSKKTADAVNRKKYEVLTAHEWLARFNRQVKRSHNPGPARHTIQFDRCVESVKKKRGRR